MARYLFSVFFTLLFSLIFIEQTSAQNQPAPFDLGTGNFTFTSQTATSTAYPTNMQGWSTSANNITTAELLPPSANQALIASGTANTFGISNIGANGFQFISTGQNPNRKVGEICVALNTTNRENILVSWTAQDMQSGANYFIMGLSLQYRIGSTGNFTNLTSTLYTSSASSQALAQIFSNVALPATCFNQPIVQLRWIYYQIGTSGSSGRDPIRLDEINISSTGIPLCSGTPSPGNTLASPNAVNAGGISVLSLQNTMSGNGITYQWQASSDNTNWTNISGATASTYSATITSSTYFQCVVTCTASSSSATSGSVLVSIIYCSSTSSGTTYFINSFTTGGGITNLNNVTNAQSSGGYGDFTSQYLVTSPGAFIAFTAQLYAGSTASTYGLAVFVDWNNDGDFLDPTEKVFTTTSFSTPPVFGDFTVPFTQAIGNYRMRVVADYFSSAPASCNNMSQGETEDYTITISPMTPCSGMPISGTANLTPGNGASGTLVSLSATGVSYNSGLTYQWQMSTDNGATFNNVPGATALNSTATIPVAPANSIILFRLVVACSLSGQSSISSNAIFTVGNYCVATVSTPSSYYVNKVSFLGTLQDITNVSTYSTNPAGYQNFTGLPLISKQAQGSGINVYFQANASVLMQSWVDWNVNGVFDASEQVYTSGGIRTSTTTFGFVVPSATVPGLYRLRLRVSYSGFTSSPACDVLSNGEAEDYLIRVIPSCPAIITGVNNSIVCGGGTTTLTVNGSAAATQYSWYSSTTSFIPLATTNSSSWVPPSISSTQTFYVTALNASCESPERTPVKAIYSSVPTLSFSPSNPVICGDGTILQLLATGDNEEAVIFSQNFETGISPFVVTNIISNGATVNGQTQWQQKASTFVPSYTSVWHPAISSGIGVNNFAFVTSDITPSGTSGTTQVNSAMTSPTLSTTGFTNLFLDFSIYFSHYLPDGTNSIIDSFLVEVSMNGGTSWTNAATYITDQGIGTLFADKTINLSSFINNANFKFRFRYRGDWCDGAAIDDVRLYGNRPLSTTYSWSPITGNNLFVDAAGSIPYTGGSVPDIYVVPTLPQLDTGVVLIFTATATLSNGCSASASVSVSIGTNQWTGTASTDWFNQNNWCSGFVPTVNSRVEIPSGIINYPVINSSALAKTIKIFNGASLLINSTGSLTLKGDFINQGTLTNNGRIGLNGSAIQNFPGSTGTVNAMSVLHVNNSGGGVMLNKSVTISKELRPESGILNLSNFDITLKSTLAQTAFVSAIGSGSGFTYGTGRFVVERYIPVGINHGKSWQFLSVPTNDAQTINAAWQEGASGYLQNSVPGYGTQITSALTNALSLGFDAYSPLANSIKFLDAAGVWTGPSSTLSTPLYNSKGYMIFVRGDRSVYNFSGSNSAPVSTILRTRGKLFDHSVNPPPVINVPAGQFVSIGNPYASPIDFSNPDGVIFDGPPYIDNVFYAWDPTNSGVQGLGGYQTISAATDFRPTPGGTFNYPMNVPNSKIQSGQAFLMQGGTLGGTVSFTEQAKSDTVRMTFRTARNANYTGEKKILWTRLYFDNNTQPKLVDGNAFVICSAFSNNNLNYDARKIMNTAENIFCRKNFKSLAVDARNQIQLQDTLFYGISNLRYGNYKLEIEPDRFDDSLHLAFLADRYNQSFTPLYLSSPNNYTFNVSSDPLSSATDRFYIVFRPLNPLSAHGINFTAKKLSEVVNVLHWNLIGNANIKRFVIERSESGSNFSEIGFLPAIRTNVHYNYEFRDEAANRSILYYRIKTILSDGGFEYSEVRRVIKNESDFYFTVFPNPVTDRNIFLTSKGLTGKKTVTISSASGQVMYSNEIELTDATTTLTIELPPAVSSGTYFIKITEAGSVVLTEKIVVK